MASPKNPTDALGNKMEIGNRVFVRLKTNDIIGFVTELEVGGVIQQPLIGGTLKDPKIMNTPTGVKLGKMKILAEIMCEFSPEANISSMFVLKNPPGRVPFPSDIPKEIQKGAGEQAPAPPDDKPSEKESN